MFCTARAISAPTWSVGGDDPGGDTEEGSADIGGGAGPGAGAGAGRRRGGGGGGGRGVKRKKTSSAAAKDSAYSIKARVDNV